MNTINTQKINKLKLFVSFLLIMLLGFETQAQSTEDILRQWPAEEMAFLKKINEESGVSRDKATELILINMARTNGPLFAKLVIPFFVDSTKAEQTSYLKSLINELKKQPKLSPLYYDNELSKVAEGHAISMGNAGKTGHDGFDERYSKVLGRATEVAENCFYGPKQPIIVVLELLIDNDVASLGHRKNLLNPAFTHIGFATAPHKTYEYNTVQSFGIIP